ncbi:AAA family ATPase [Microvirgula aerodenitrificans]|uniref:AAA family ATPase n=1 Tax=Microvirgula aerodenitrificans TaxID=57480 RepID=UPI00049102C4|nr:AAA family ATPase [Microvirgula aerodenitrificans]
MSMIDMLRPSAGKQASHAEFVAFLADDESAAIVQRYVAQRMLPHAHVARGNVDQAIEFLQKLERAPLQLLIDVSGSDTPLSELARLADACEPSVEVYVVGGKNDVGLYRSLLQLGVRDYLVKPLTVDLLMRMLGKSEPLQQARTGKVITLLGTRGGVGVSTIATHLGRYLANVSQRRVALVDLNLHGGTVNILLGLDSNNGLTDVLQNVQRLDTQYMERTLVAHSSRLFVLSAELDFEQAFPLRAGAAAELINVLKQHFHYVLVDAPPPGLCHGELTEEALTQSKVVYVVADRSVHSARNIARLVRYAGNRENEPVVSLLLNQPAPVSAAHVASADLADACRRAVLQELPYDALSVATAENLGEALAAKSTFGLAIARLADDLSGTAQKPQVLSRWRQLLKRGG